MKRKEALAELIEDVSQDDWPTPANCKEAKISHSLTEKAFEGSLDAAKALHEAVLPGFTFWQITRVNDNFFMVSVCDIPRAKGAWLEPSYRGESPDNPARAWLLAILRALQSMEPEA